MTCTLGGLLGLQDLVRYLLLVILHPKILIMHIATQFIVWGTNSPCCGADTGSLEPGNANDLGQPKCVYSDMRLHHLIETFSSAFQTVWPAAIKPNIPFNSTSLPYVRCSF